MSVPSFLSSLTDKNLGQLRVLNAVTFPVSYSDKFYEDIMLGENLNLTHLCKLPTHPESAL
jgi:hypothetical protein